MIVQHNMLAMNANNRYGKNIIAKSKSAEKLASGYRINRAADDAAGLEISSRLNKQVKGLNQGLMNAQDGISLCQVADGALSEATDMLQRMNELTLQAANGTNSDSDREAIQMEIDQLKGELDRVGETTEFNEEKVFKNPDPEAKGFMTPFRLVKSDSALAGRMIDAYYYKGNQVGTNIDRTGWYPSGNLDFTDIDALNVHELYDKSFSFVCTEGCGETFTFTMIDGDGTQSSWNDETQNTTKDHNYMIDIHGLKDGKQVVDKIYDFVKNNPAWTETYSNGKPIFEEGIKVSHAATLAKNGESILAVVADKKDYMFTSESAAKQKFANNTGDEALVDCTIYGYEPEAVRDKNTYSIQAGAQGNEKVEINIGYMSSGTLDVDDVDVTSMEGATYAIEKINKALSIVTRERSYIGAQQNRLEHSILNLGNISENTTAAYSKIKDTDMASEMVKFSNMNIIASANESVMAQANQMNEGVLALLQ